MSSTVTIKISGMHCQNCQKRVQTALQSLDGVQRVKVDLKKSEATITSLTELDINEFRKVIDATGYVMEG